LLYAFGFIVSYTLARTLGSAYHYNPLKIGLVLLTFGGGPFNLFVFPLILDNYKDACWVAYWAAVGLTVRLLD
jgi:hypothetical protein